MEIIAVEEALALKNRIFVDVRSPGEFQQSSIPGAVNLPLLDDAERATVGTCYKKVGPEAAKDIGMAYVSPKLPEMLKQIRELHAVYEHVVIYCWRGGMRSRSVAGLMSNLGLRVWQLRGGYKAYRRHVLASLQQISIQPKVFVLCGSTGVGKTQVLQRLPALGIAMLDLEKMANHRGSVFGQVGLGAGISAADFDATILQALEEQQQKSSFVVECESKRIGNIYIPDVLYKAMQQGPRILLRASLETRVQRLIAEYVDGTEERQTEIRHCIQMLETRFGSNKTEKVRTLFEAGELSAVVRTLLTDYYDPLYGYETAPATKFSRVIEAEDLDTAAADIATYLSMID